MENNEKTESAKILNTDTLIPKIIPKLETELIKSDDSINYEEINSTRIGVINQILLTCAVLLTAAACGMPIGYSAIVLPQLYNSSDSLSIDTEMGSWIASVHSAATPFGSFASGPIMDRWGRRPALLIAIVPLALGWILIACSSSHFILLLGRIVAGFAVGIIAAPAQILIAECAEPKLRGMLIGAPFVSYSLGILLVYALGSVFHWRIVAWCGTILPAISFISLFIAYESPVWLARNGHQAKAVKALTWLRGDYIYVKKELQQLEQRIANEKALAELNKDKTERFFDLLKEKSVFRPIIVLNSFNMLLVLSGTYLVVFYAADIISEFGEDINTMHAIVLTAVLRLIFTIIYCYLLHVVKRRKMVILCGIGSGLSSIALALFSYIRLGQQKNQLDLYFTAVCILIYLGANTGFMAMPGCMVGELLPAKIRGRYAGYIFAFFNFTLFCVAKVFPLAHYTLKTQGLFLIFGLASFSVSILMYFILPETKGKSLNDIEDIFTSDNWLRCDRHKSINRNQMKNFNL